MANKLIKLASKTCTPCKVVESMLNDHDIPHKSYFIEDPGGELLAEKYNVQSVPTMILLDEKDNVIKIYKGIPNFAELKNKLAE